MHNPLIYLGSLIWTRSKDLRINRRYYALIFNAFGPSSIAKTRRRAAIVSRSILNAVGSLTDQFGSIANGCDSEDQLLDWGRLHSQHRQPRLRNGNVSYRQAVRCGRPGDALQSDLRRFFPVACCRGTVTADFPRPECRDVHIRVLNSRGSVKEVIHPLETPEQRKEREAEEQKLATQKEIDQGNWIASLKWPRPPANTTWPSGTSR